MMQRSSEFLHKEHRQRSRKSAKVIVFKINNDRPNKFMKSIKKKRRKDTERIAHFSLQVFC
jgi:hypothetical protein